MWLLLFGAVAAAAGQAGGDPAGSPPPWVLQFDGGEGEPRWVAVNDGVMGGLSEGGAAIRGGSLHFTGTLSLENNGGFSSVRTRDWRRDLSGCDAIVLRVRGDGRTYQLRLSTDARFRDSPISYQAGFATVAGTWTEVRVPFSTLVPGWRGRTLDGPPFDPAKVEEMGLLIGDKRAGEFRLEVDWIRAEPKK